MCDCTTTGLTGPEFLEAVADSELARGNNVNADIYRQRARDWKQDLADLESVNTRNRSLQQALDSARAAVALPD